MTTRQLTREAFLLPPAPARCIAACELVCGHLLDDAYAARAEGLLELAVALEQRAHEMRQAARQAAAVLVFVIHSSVCN